MKLFLMLMVLSVMSGAAIVVNPADAWAQSNTGNGGSKIEIDFKDYGLKFYRYLLTAEGKANFPEIDAEKFKNALQAEVEVVRYSLRDKDGKLKTCVNLELNGESLIRVNRKAWREDSQKPVTQLRNVIHEYLGVAGIGGDDERLNYVYTLRITADMAMKILISGKGAENQQVAPVEASEAILAEVELKREREAQEQLNQRIRTTEEAEQKERLESRQKEVDLASVQALKCVEKILTKQLGGKYSADYAVSTLVELKSARAQALASQDLSGLKAVTERCQSTARSLKKEKTDRWAVIQYAQQRKSETKIELYSLVKGFVRPTVAECVDRKLSVFAGALWGGSVGVGAADCTLTNGRRWISVGVNAGLGVGGGGFVSVSQTLTGPQSKADLQGAHVVRPLGIVLTGGATEESIVGIVDLDTWDEVIESLQNPNRPRQKQTPPGYEGPRSERDHKVYSVGFGGVVMDFQAGVRVPMIPLKRNYRHIFKQL